MNRKRKPRPLTDRQRSVWEFIAGEIKEKGLPPTLREIGAEFSIGSTNGVRTLLDAIETKGFLKRTPFISRGFEILKWPPHLVEEESQPDVRIIPLVGSVAAGTPLLAEQNLDGHLVLDKSLFPAGDGFGLRVKGKSMIEAGINDGDIVLARPGLPHDPGKIVVALINDEATVKYYYPEPYGARLEPANRYFEPIKVERDIDNFMIVGTVVGLYRKY